MRCHQSTKQLQLAKPLLVLGLFLFGFVLLSWLLSPLLQAKTTDNPTVGLQGRLLKKSGTPVPNGNYNVEFRLYQGGSGQKAGNPGGKLVWKESYTNSGSKKGVKVSSGRFAVQLGSERPFSGSIDWSKNNLWLSMNVAGLGECSSFGTGNCSADGELLPMKHVSATPFAISAGKLGDKSADDFVQLGQGKQTDSGDNSSIFVDKTGKGHLIQLQTDGKDSFMVSRDGDITLSGRSDRSITLSKQEKAGSHLTLQAGEGKTSGGDLELKGGDGGDRGGDIVLRGGTSNDGSSSGLVIIGTPTFETTASDANCYPGSKLASKSCQVTQTSIDQSAAIVVGFDQPDQIVELPDPTRKDPGQLRYIIGATDSEAFTVTLTNNEGSLTVLPDTAVALLWSGKDWISMSAQTPSAPKANDKEPATPEDDDSAEPTDDDDYEVEDELDYETEDGSMYYNEDLGKIQCYQDSTWGDCSAAPDVFVTISPEYANAVMNGGDLGTITSDFCSDQLKVNNGSDDQPKICDKDETHNFYQWSTDEDKTQTRSIYISYKLPANFKQFIDESTSLTARTNAKGAGVSYRLYRDSKSDGLTACGKATMLSSKDSRWHALMAEDQADPANCEFNPGDGMLIRIDLKAQQDSDAFVSDINFIYSSH